MDPSTKRTTWLLCLFLALLALPALALEDESTEPVAETESAAGASPMLVHTDEVFVDGVRPAIPTSNTVAAKLPLALRETPASVGVVDRRRIDEQNARSLGDALVNISGLNTQTGNGVFDFFVVRGLDSISSGLILSDGAPEPETAFYQLYNVERVEVLKGPSAFLYGASPLGGTANLVRRQPVGERFTRLALDYGSFGTVEGTLDTNLASDDGRWSFRLNSLWRESDGYRDDKPSEIFAVNPAITWRPNDDTSLNINLETIDSEYASDAGLPLIFGTTVPEVPRERSYQSPFDISDQRIDRVQIDFETRLGDRTVLRNKAYYRSLDWDSTATIFNGAFPTGFGDTVVSRSLLLLDDRQEFYGNQLELIVRFETGSVTHNLLAGVELAQQNDRFTFDVGFLPDISLENPVETAFEPIFLLPGQSFGADAESTIVAPYVIDQIALSDRWQVLAGLRWDSIDFEDAVLQTSRSDSEVSPMLGVVYTPSDALSLYANAGSAFAPPSTFVVDPQREPETSDQIEVGVKKGFRNDRVRTSLALFQIDRENIAIPDDNGVTQQTGDQRSRGVELEIAAELTSRSQLFFAYAYTDAELTEFAESLLVGFFPPTFATVDRSGNKAAFAPEHLANVWLSQELSSDWRFGIGARYVGEQFIAEDNVFEIEDALTVDAALFYSPGPLELSLHLENVTDEEYLTRGFGSTSVIPAPGFSATAGVSYTF